MIPFAFASAVLTSLAFHPVGLHFLAWFGMVPVFFALEHASRGRAFICGLVFGTLFALFSLFWIVFLQIPLSVKILMIFGMVLLFLYHGLYIGVGFVFAKFTSVWLLPFIFCGLEFIRGIGEIGFPWLTLGYTQAPYPVIIQQASVYGLYGLSFWVVLANVAIYCLVKNRRLVNAVVAAAVFLVPVGYGLIRMSRPLAGGPVIVGITQPDIDPNLKYSREMRDKTFKLLLDLSAVCIDRARSDYDAPCDLVIWPESATPIFLKTPNIFRERVLKFADSTGVPILSGTPIYDFKLREAYNGAVLLEPGMVLNQEYKKLHLVPFGEHIPFDRYVPLFREVDLGEGDYIPGSEYTVFARGDLKFSCLICFEAIFPELARRFVNEGARMLVNITNDGWFGRISGPQQHKNMAILRAVENGVPLVRCANTGISTTVDKYGRLSDETGLFMAGSLTEKIFIDDEKTPYRVLGDFVPIASLILVLLATGLTIKRLGVKS